MSVGDGATLPSGLAICEASILHGKGNKPMLQFKHL